MLRRHQARASILSALALGVLACGDREPRANPWAVGSASGSDTGASTSGTSTSSTGGDATSTSGGEGPTTLDDDDTGNDDDTPQCIDLDGDGYGENCPAGPDCDDDNPLVWTEAACETCADNDGDGYWVGCDAYDSSKPGPDCDDADPYVWTEAGCAGCVDNDRDGTWAGCDGYGDGKPGPDCDDDNPLVGADDEGVVEVCDGLAQNCAGEIDPGSPNELCPSPGVDAPNVATWACNPPAPGEDGCAIAACEDQFFNLDNLIQGGCECAGTSRTVSLGTCGDAPEGYLGSVAEGTQLPNLPIGTIPMIDNGIGGGNEDWYRVQFPEAAAIGTRPNVGSIRVDFAVNSGNDYRFQVFRTCAGVPWSGGLATQFGVGAPPAREWWFFDNHVPPSQMPVPALYQNNIAWPEQVYIRVFRVQNNATCNTYQLRIQRVSN